jgi:hypothetical protein
MSFMSIDPEVLILLDRVPELVDAYLDGVEAGDDDPGYPMLLTELADMVTEAVRKLEQGRTRFERCLAAIEDVLDQHPDATDAVAGAFFDSLPPDILPVLTPSLGPRSGELLERLEEGLEPRASLDG